MTTQSRMNREAKTVEVMIRRYCHDKHGAQPKLCPECRELLTYAGNRLLRCPFQEGKTTCGNCKIHCYKPVMRERIREIMRYVGPRMLFSHPLMAVQHIIDGLRKEPVRKEQD